MNTGSPSRLDSTQNQHHFIHRLSDLFLYSLTISSPSLKELKGREFLQKKKLSSVLFMAISSNHTVIKAMIRIFNLIL